VPFILYDPSPAADATRGRVDTRFVEAIDALPTMLEALALDPAEHLLEGRSLLALTRNQETPWRDAVFSELDWTFRGARRRLGLPTRPASRLDGAHGALEIHPLDRWAATHAF